MMVRVREKDVYGALLKYAGKGEPFKVGKAKIQVSLQPQDIHVGNSPDFILWLKVSLRLFAQDLKIKIPIPIEAEARGMDEALEDLKKFIERSKHSIELPMLVIAAKGYKTSKQAGKLPIQFIVKQIPIRLLEY